MTSYIVLQFWVKINHFHNIFFYEESYGSINYNLSPAYNNQVVKKSWIYLNKFFLGNHPTNLKYIFILTQTMTKSCFSVYLLRLSFW